MYAEALAKKIQHLDLGRGGGGGGGLFIGTKTSAKYGCAFIENENVTL